MTEFHPWSNDTQPAEETVVIKATLAVGLDLGTNPAVCKGAILSLGNT
jgi:hypothetical protein